MDYLEKYKYLKDDPNEFEIDLKKFHKILTNWITVIYQTY